MSVIDLNQEQGSILMIWLGLDRKAGLTNAPDNSANHNRAEWLGVKAQRYTNYPSAHYFTPHIAAAQQILLISIIPFCQE